MRGLTEMAAMTVFGFLMLCSGLLGLIVFLPLGIILIPIGVILIYGGFSQMKTAKEYDSLGGKKGTGMTFKDFADAKIKIEQDLAEDKKKQAEEKKKQNILKVKDLTKRKNN